MTQTFNKKKYLRWLLIFWNTVTLKYSLKYMRFSGSVKGARTIVFHIPRLIIKIKDKRITAPSVLAAINVCTAAMSPISFRESTKLRIN